MGIHIFDEKLRDNLWNYVWQSGLAALCIFVILLVMNVTTRQGIVVAAIGSSAFVAFMMPDSPTSNARNILGGHWVGVMSGLCGIALYKLLDGMGWSVSLGGIGTDLDILIATSIATGLSIFLLAATDTEHAPAAGTALGLSTMYQFDEILISIIFILVSALILVGMKETLKSRLKDLL